MSISFYLFMGTVSIAQAEIAYYAIVLSTRIEWGSESKAYPRIKKSTSKANRRLGLKSKAARAVCFHVFSFNISLQNIKSTHFYIAHFLIYTNKWMWYSQHDLRRWNITSGPWVSGKVLYLSHFPCQSNGYVLPFM